MEKNSIQSIFIKCTKLFFLFLLLSFKGFSQQAPIYTIKYERTEFCAGVNAFSNPIITNSKGEIMPLDFTKKVKLHYIKIKGEGVLSIDEKGGIDLLKSDVGIYAIQFNYGTSIISTNINLIKCK